MRWDISTTDPRKEWHPWFAWRPVRVDLNVFGWDLGVWLEHIERKLELRSLKRRVP